MAIQSAVARPCRGQVRRAGRRGGRPAPFISHLLTKCFSLVMRHLMTGICSEKMHSQAMWSLCECHRADSHRTRWYRLVHT